MSIFRSSYIQVVSLPHVVLCPRCCGCGPTELVCSRVHCLSVSFQHVEAIYENKIIVKLFASSWYISLLQIKYVKSHNIKCAVLITYFPLTFYDQKLYVYISSHVHATCPTLLAVKGKDVGNQPLSYRIAVYVLGIVTKDTVTQSCRIKLSHRAPISNC